MGKAAKNSTHQVDTRVVVVMRRTAKTKQADQIPPKACTGLVNHIQRVNTSPLPVTRFCSCMAYI